MLLISTSQAQDKLVDSIKEMRLAMYLTQEGLADRSGVPLPTLRKFEQKVVISLESFLKLLWVLGGLEEMVTALKPSVSNFTSIDEVIRNKPVEGRKRGRRK
jgi:transcriptional regulator with XRE-family HTH domain